uniref:Uncharacterized protein n=1 Tax=Anopheles dirus TaxID=7168 RepID=A0A182NWP2_9DIPT
MFQINQTLFFDIIVTIFALVCKATIFLSFWNILDLIALHLVVQLCVVFRTINIIYTFMRRVWRIISSSVILSLVFVLVFVVYTYEVLLGMLLLILIAFFYSRITPTVMQNKCERCVL